MDAQFSEHPSRKSCNRDTYCPVVCHEKEMMCTHAASRHTGVKVPEIVAVKKWPHYAGTRSLHKGEFKFIKGGDCGKEYPQGVFPYTIKGTDKIPECFLRDVLYIGFYPIDVPMCGLEGWFKVCLLYTSPSPRDGLLSRMPSSA